MPVLEPDPPVAVASLTDVLTLAEAKQAVNLSGVTTYDVELVPWVTAASMLLDYHLGPIVVRTITDEVHDGTDGPIFLRRFPVTSFTSVTEYNGLVATVLTGETNVAKPPTAYVAQRYPFDATLFSGRMDRRASAGDAPFPSGMGNVVVTYVAGRFANTAAVDERFKSAARLTLSHLWLTQRPGLAQVGEFEVPTQQFPRWAVPRAAQELFPGEWQTGQWAGGPAGVLVA